MPQYRGNYGWTGRAALRGCATEIQHDPRRGGQFCHKSSPPECPAWICTRKEGHAGDHVAHSDARIVLARWGQDGSLTDSEEG
jgi:hypothetical protein